MDPIPSVIPPAVTTLWTVLLVLTYVVFLPLAVYLLHTALRASRSIQIYAREALMAAGGIASHTKHLPALGDTIDVGGQILNAAQSVNDKLEVIANVLGDRAGKA